MLQEPDIDVSREALPEPDEYRGVFSIGDPMLSPMVSWKELENELKELKGFATL